MFSLLFGGLLLVLVFGDGFFKCFLCLLVAFWVVLAQVAGQGGLSIKVYAQQATTTWPYACGFCFQLKAIEGFQKAPAV